MENPSVCMGTEMKEEEDEEEDKLGTSPGLRSHCHTEVKI